MSELRSMLRGLESQVIATAQGRPEFSLAVASRKVRGNKVTRTVRLAAAAVGAGAVIGVGMWTLMGQFNHNQPAVTTPSPSALVGPTVTLPTSPSPTASASPSGWQSPLHWSDRGTESDPVWALTTVDYPLPEGAGAVYATVGGTRGAIDIVVLADDGGFRRFFEVADGNWTLVKYPAGNPPEGYYEYDDWSRFLAAIPGSTLDITTRYADFTPPPEPDDSGFTWDDPVYPGFRPQSLGDGGSDLLPLLPSVRAERATSLPVQSLTRIFVDRIPADLTLTEERRGIAGPAGLVRFALVSKDEVLSQYYRPMTTSDTVEPQIALVTVQGVNPADLVEAGFTLSDGRTVYTASADSSVVQLALDEPYFDDSQVELLAFSEGPSIYVTDFSNADFLNASGTRPSVILVPTKQSGSYEVWVVGIAIRFGM